MIELDDILPITHVFARFDSANNGDHNCGNNYKHAEDEDEHRRQIAPLDPLIDLRLPNQRTTKSNAKKVYGEIPLD